MDNVYLLNYLVNRQLSRAKGKMVVLLVDLRAAFDTVDREILWKTMREGLVRRCEDLLRETRNRVRIEERSGQFWTGRRVKQGCPLSSSLFNLLRPKSAPRSKRGDEEGRMEVRLRGEKIYTLAYTGDIAFVDSEVRKICEGEEAGGECEEIKN